MVTGYVQGVEVLRQLQHAHSSLGGQLRLASGKFEQLERAAGDAVRERGQALLQLAKQYLPDISQQTVSNSFADVRRELQDVLARKVERERQLRLQWEQALDRRAELEQQLDTATDQLNALVDRREELEQRLAELLTEHSEFNDLSDKAVTAEAQLARNELRVQQSRRDAAEKLPAYKRSRMFQYLLERGYGTPEYKRFGLTRTLDKWVARLVDFHKAKKSYNFLRVTPELMAAEVARRRSEFDGLMEQIEAIERETSDEIGLTQALEDGVQAGERRDALVAKLDAQQTERDKIEGELAEIDSDRGEFYQQAVARMKRFLESVEESSLESHAKSTASRRDDALVDEIRSLGEQVDSARDQAARMREDFSLGQRRMGDLGDLVRQFRRSEFDGRRSVFRKGFDARPLVDSFLSGHATKQSLWRELRANQEFLPQWVEERWDPPNASVLDNDFSYVLMRVLAEAAGAMIEHSARKEWPQGPWQTRGGRVGGPAAPRRRKRSARPPSVRRRARGGFTTGRGF